MKPVVASFDNKIHKWIGSQWWDVQREFTHHVMSDWTIRKPVLFQFHISLAHTDTAEVAVLMKSQYLICKLQTFNSLSRDIFSWQRLEWFSLFPGGNSSSWQQPGNPFEIKSESGSGSHLPDQVGTTLNDHVTTTSGFYGYGAAGMAPSPGSKSDCVNS